MERFELSPKDGRKSFYGKAIVKVADDGTEILQSYDTDVLMRKPDGTLIRLWDDWSATTGRHIKAFCGLDKKGYMKLKKGELKMKVKFDRTGPSGNIFWILGAAYAGLLELGRREDAEKMNDRVMASSSYEEALKIIGEYVELAEVKA